MMRPRQLLASTVAWIAAAGTAVIVGLFALSQIGFGPTAAPVRPPQRYADAAVTTPSPTRSASTPKATPRPRNASGATRTTQPASPAPVTSTDREFTSLGGTVVARCRANDSYLVYWTPAQGFWAD